MKLEAIKAKLDQKSQELNDLVTNSDNIDEIKSVTDEVNALKGTYNTLLEAKNASTPLGVVSMEVKNIDSVGHGQAILEGKSVTLKVSDIEGLDLKTAVTTTAGFPAPKPAIANGTLIGPNPGSALFDRVEKFKLNSVSELYYLQNTRTNNSGIGTENTAPTDNVDSFDEVVITAKPVISWIPVSEAVMRSLQSNNLSFLMNDVVRMAKVKIDADMITGNAGGASAARTLASSVLGFANSTVTQIVGGSAATNLNYRYAIDYASAFIESNGDNAVFLLVNPYDRALIVNQKDNNNAFVWQTQGAYATYNNLELISDANVTAGTCWILGSMGIRTGMLDDLVVETGFSGTDFTKGAKSIRAICHVGHMVRPYSLYKLTLT